MLWEHLIF